jgi:O-antigen ligase
MPRRAVTAALQLGLIGVVFAVLPFKLFELDRYFVPKELALHVVAFIVLALLLARERTNMVDAADAMLALFLVWSTASALFATNYWLAQRALGISVSSAIVFWGARRIGAAGFHRPILVGASIATVCAAATCLAQAYGLETDYFSLNRSPGGTFGNRNFVAHFSAIGLSALTYTAVTARRAGGALAGTVGVAIVAAALVLTRSRAAWLAVAASMGMLLLALLMSRAHWRGGGYGGRFARLAAGAAVGAALGIFLPNRLNWSSDSPYLDSARGMVDYRSGSGRGRVAQYLNSARMATAHPVFGVGPGNWPVRYVRFAPESDASIADNGMTANPWPSSDWVAHISERGVVATAALLGVFLSLFIGALRRWHEMDDETVLVKVALIGTIVATLVVSAFDAALLLAAPAMLAWSVIGAASGVGRVGRPVTLKQGMWATVVVLTLLITGASVARSAAQTVAILTVANGGLRDGWYVAAIWDRGSYRINLRSAELRANRGQCASARTYARRALALFPYASAPRRILQRCG